MGLLCSPFFLLELIVNFEKKLIEALEKECDKLINRYHNYHCSLHSEHDRKIKKLQTVNKKIIKRPAYWETNKGCDPFYVKKNAKAIAKSVAKKISNETYKPLKTSILEVPKNDGKVRTVVIYQIVDAVVSKIFYQRLLAKNKHRFSSFAYAYRNDRNVHFAIQDISLGLRRNDRSFVAEFDFSDFFGNISHEYLFNQFDKNGFLISKEEIIIIKSFLDIRKGKGIPQGTSISLFLANLACWQLDYKLEQEGLKFARYADDTLIWSTDYQKICNAFNIMTSFSRAAKIPINAKKSKGISLLQKDEYDKSEFSDGKTTSYIDFLGYSISVDNISFKDDTVKKIKQQISYILYSNLIQPLRRNQFRVFTPITKKKDYNLSVALMQIKRYMYGNLKKQYLINYITGRSKRLHFKGIMSFYPLVNNRKQLYLLDAWLEATIHRCLKLREKLLVSQNIILQNSYAFSLDKKTLLAELNKSHYYEVPSFTLISKALQYGIRNDGLHTFIRHGHYDYNYG